MVKNPLNERTNNNIYATRGNGNALDRNEVREEQRRYGDGGHVEAIS